MKANEKEINIEELLRLVREGDQAAFPALLAAYEPLVRAEVARYTTEVDACDVEDFRQTALVAFSNAALNFDLSQCGVEFGLFAKICICNALASYLRKWKNRKRLLNSAEPLDESDNGANDPVTPVLEEEAFRALCALIRKLLSPFENRVWWLYVSGCPAKEIGRVLGKDTHSIENAIYRIRKKLSKELGEWR